MTFAQAIAATESAHELRRLAEARFVAASKHHGCVAESIVDARESARATLRAALEAVSAASDEEFVRRGSGT